MMTEVYVTNGEKYQHYIVESDANGELLTKHRMKVWLMSMIEDTFRDLDGPITINIL